MRFAEHIARVLFFKMRYTCEIVVELAICSSGSVACVCQAGYTCTQDTYTHRLHVYADRLRIHTWLHTCIFTGYIYIIHTGYLYRVYSAQSARRLRIDSIVSRAFASRQLNGICQMNYLSEVVILQFVVHVGLVLWAD